MSSALGSGVGGSAAPTRSRAAAQRNGTSWTGEVSTVLLLRGRPSLDCHPPEKWPDRTASRSLGQSSAGPCSATDPSRPSSVGCSGQPRRRTDQGLPGHPPPIQDGAFRSDPGHRALFLRWPRPPYTALWCSLTRACRQSRAPQATDADYGYGQDMSVFTHNGLSLLSICPSSLLMENLSLPPSHPQVPMENWNRARTSDSKSLGGGPGWFSST